MGNKITSLWYNYQLPPSIHPTIAPPYMQSDRGHEYKTITSHFSMQNMAWSSHWTKAGAQKPRFCFRIEHWAAVLNHISMLLCVHCSMISLSAHALLFSSYNRGSVRTWTDKPIKSTRKKCTTLFFKATESKINERC